MIRVAMFASLVGTLFIGYLVSNHHDLEDKFGGGFSACDNHRVQLPPPIAPKDAVSPAALEFREQLAEIDRQLQEELAQMAKQLPLQYASPAAKPQVPKPDKPNPAKPQPPPKVVKIQPGNPGEILTWDKEKQGWQWVLLAGRNHHDKARPCPPFCAD